MSVSIGCQIATVVKQVILNVILKHIIQIKIK